MKRHLLFLVPIFFTFLLPVGLRGQSCQAGFTSVYGSNTIYFTNTSTGNATNWLWDFGDGFTSNLKNPMPRQYSKDGFFNVCLTAYDSVSCFNKYCKEVKFYIVDPMSCKNVTGQSNFIRKNDRNLFTFTSTVKDTSLKHYWSFGDSSTSNMKNPEHLFKKEGNYNVCLTTYNDTSCTKYCTNITVAPLCKFTADFSFDKISGDFWHFTDKSFNQGYTGFTTWTWDFADGTTSNLQNPNHSFTSPLQHNICLTIGDSAKTCTNTICKNLRQCGTKPDFSIEKLTATTWGFKDLSLNQGDLPYTQWKWDFGDGTSSAVQSPDHEYTKTGTDTVCLTISDSAKSCVKTICKKLPLCGIVSDFTFQHTSDRDISFKTLVANNGGIPITTYHWDFGDGKYDSAPNPSHHFEKQGVFNLCLSVSNTTKSCLSKRCYLTAIAPSWSPSSTAGGLKADVGTSIYADVNGNIYYTGSFKSPDISFGTTTIANTGSDSSDVFIVKQGPDGKVLWAKSIGGSRGDSAQSISGDASGNIFVTGTFRSDTLKAGNILIKNAGTSKPDLYIIKYDAAGNALWARSIEDHSNNGVVAAFNGEAYVAGTFTTPALKIGSVTLTSIKKATAYLVKFDVNGNISWTKKSEDGDARCNAIAVDPKGNIIITGSFDKLVLFDSKYITNDDGSRSENVFIVKYNNDGKLQWADMGVIHSYYTAFGNSLATDPKGNIYVLASGVYIMKYNEYGTFMWQKLNADGNTNIFGNSITVDKNGNTIVTGKYTGTIAFDSDIRLTCGTGPCMFAAKYDQLGYNAWAKSVDGSEGADVAVVSDGSAHIVGSYKKTNILLDTVHTNKGSSDVFIAKIENVDCPNPPLKPTITAQGNILTATGDAEFYRWYQFGNFTFQVFRDSTGPTFSMKYNDHYAVRAYRTGCFTVLSEMQHYVKTSIEDVAELSDIKVYPNPGDENFFISGTTLEKLNVEVYDLLGRHFDAPIATTNKVLLIDTQHLPSGVYIIKLTDKAQLKCTYVKWVKE